MECRLPLIEWQYWSYTDEMQDEMHKKRKIYLLILLLTYLVSSYICKSRYIFLFSKFALSLSIIQKFKDEGKSSNYWHPRNFLPYFVRVVWLCSTSSPNVEKLRRQLGLPELQMYWKAQRDKTNDLCDVWLAKAKHNPTKNAFKHNKEVLVWPP